MKQSYFMKIYKKRWTYRFIALGIWGLFIVGLICIGIDTYYNNTNNPTVVKNIEDYKKALNKDSYVKISSDKLYDLNVVMTETRSKFGVKISENIKSNIVAIKLDELVLAVELPNKEYEQLIKQEKGPYILKGNLVEFKEKDLNILRQSVQENEDLSHKAKLETYYQYLRYESPIDSASAYFGGAAIFLLFVLVLFIPVMRKNTTALKSLKNYSNGDIETACQQIDNEITLSNVYKNGPVTITQNYIIVETQQIVFALPLKELMWVYTRIIKKKAAFIIPAGKTTSLVFVFSDKRTYEVNLFKHAKIMDSVIEYISKNSGTAFIGYSKELHKLFKKHPEEFILKWKNHKESSENENMEDLNS